MSGTNHTVEKLARIVGEDEASTDRERLEPFREAPLVSGARPQALLRPTSTDEVKDLIILARQEGMNLVFSSSAGSRFRGDRCWGPGLGRKKLRPHERRTPRARASVWLGVPPSDGRCLAPSPSGRRLG